MTDKQLTPMQEAIKIFKDAQKHIISNTEFAKGYDGAITDVITNLEKLIPKEEQFIVNSIIECDKLCLQAQDYYNNKFIKD